MSEHVKLELKNPKKIIHKVQVGCEETSPDNEPRFSKSLKFGPLPSFTSKQPHGRLGKVKPSLFSASSLETSKKEFGKFFKRLENGEVSPKEQKNAVELLSAMWIEQQKESSSALQEELTPLEKHQRYLFKKTGLRFPPEKITDLPSMRQKEMAKAQGVKQRQVTRDDILRETWGAYIDAGYMTTGFLRDYDFKLYSVYNGASVRGKISLSKMLKEQGLLIGEDFKSPSIGNLQAIKDILHFRELLKTEALTVQRHKELELEN